MYFAGDTRSIRKKVDLGGRSSKEKDRNNYLHETRIAREQRQRQRLHNRSALHIQKCYRGRRAASTARAIIRQQFCKDFGEFGEHADRNAFIPSSKYLPQLLFFFRSSNPHDIQCLVQACRLFLQLVRESEKPMAIFGFRDDLVSPTIKYRMRHFTLCCLQALYQIREHVKLEILGPLGCTDSPGLVLLDTLLVLTDSELPWGEIITEHVLQNYSFCHIREILLMVQDVHKERCADGASSFDNVLARLCSYNTKKFNRSEDVYLSFSIQILSFPLLWKRFPYLKQVFTKFSLLPHYVHQVSTVLPSLPALLPPDTSPQFPSHCCILGNILELAVLELPKPGCPSQTAVEFAKVSRYLFADLSSKLKNLDTKASDFDDKMDIGDENHQSLDNDLEDQIFSAIDLYSLELVRHLCEHAISKNKEDMDVSAVSAICAFLDVAFTIIPFDRLVTSLAYKTELVPKLWFYMKWCHLNEKWPQMEDLSAYSSGDAPGWLLPLSVFCPVYRHMLMIIDNEEFYDKQTPLSLQDVALLVNILKEALWHLLWVIPSKPSGLQKYVRASPVESSLTLQSIQTRVSTLAAELLAQLQDWNCRRQVVLPEDFHAREAIDGYFIAQAGFESAKVCELLKKAPFLVPFTTRVQIYTSQLAAARQKSSRYPLSRHRIKIRRNMFIEDAFNELREYSGDDLKGMIRVTFINEHGAEEAGVDGGGLFKEFMENVTKIGFDIQYGLFKETADHLLYPNPASGTIHPDHLFYFEFLGKILGKAMFEGILVDIPFTTFFLSKLKEKHNYLHDLTSLDPEFYNNLLKLKNYGGDISELGLYFVSENNEFGECKEVELLPGGKDIQVTNSNIIRFIHLVANHRLNNQIRSQSSAFLGGFQQLIRPEWIAMFNEHELQLLISGSTEGVDVDDLRANTNYAGGYDEKHPIIVMFWEVLKEFTMDQRQKFLKFVTGCSRGPLLGFKYLEPVFCIQRAATEEAPEELLRLPTSATCANLLKLPPYTSKNVLKRKLLYSISSDAGFDLS